MFWKGIEKKETLAKNGIMCSRYHDKLFPNEFLWSPVNYLKQVVVLN